MLKRVCYIIVTFLLLFSSFNVPVVNAKEEWILAVHIGAQSHDRHNNTETEIQQLIKAVCKNIPNSTHIVVSTYFDYPEQIALWLDAIHECDKKAWLRSAGFNSWQQTNGVTEISTPQQYLLEMEEWITTNCELFEKGDRFEAVPDEPSNGTYWQEKFKTEGLTAEVREEFNYFLTEAHDIARDAFNSCGLEDVVIDGVHDNPSVIKDIVDQRSALSLPLLGTDNYPRQSDGIYTAKKMGRTMKLELEDWVKDAHPKTPKCVTIGPSPYAELDPEEQSLSMFVELFAILMTLPGARCITVWQVGDISNWPNNRLLENVGSEAKPSWKPRPAAKIVDIFYGYLQSRKQ